jgi:hypothetical protein
MTGSAKQSIVQAVIASAAKQSIAQRARKQASWIASSQGLLAMTVVKSGHDFASPRRDFARVVLEFSAPENRGRGECRAPDAPAASCALLVVSMHTSIHSEPSEITRHSRTQWFTAYTVLSPVIGFLATVVTRIAPRT